MIKGYLLCCLFSPLIFHVFPFCFPCWLNNFFSFVRSWKDNTESLGLHNSGRLASAYMHGHMHGRMHGRTVHLATHNSALSSFIIPMHRCRVCYWLMKNNLSKSVVALRQPFSPNVTFKGSSMLTHYCSKATEPRNCLGQLNEPPIMNAVIKWPLMR